MSWGVLDRVLPIWAASPCQSQTGRSSELHLSEQYLQASGLT